MRRKLYLRHISAGILLCVAIAGCNNNGDHVEVLVKNESGQELRNIRIELGATVRNLATLKPGEAKSIKFPVMSGEASFVVSAEGANGTSVKMNVGYVDHSIRASVISFQRLPSGSGVDVHAETRF